MSKTSGLGVPYSVLKINVSNCDKLVGSDKSSTLILLYAFSLWFICNLPLSSFVCNAFNKDFNPFGNCVNAAFDEPLKRILA